MNATNFNRPMMHQANLRFALGALLAVGAVLIFVFFLHS